MWWEVIHVLDALTVDASGSPSATIDLVDDEEAETFRHDTRGSLRLIEGGA